MENSEDLKNVSSYSVFLLLCFVLLGVWLFLQDKGTSCEASLNHPQGCHEVSHHIHEGTKTRIGKLLVDSCDFWQPAIVL